MHYMCLLWIRDVIEKIPESILSEQGVYAQRKGYTLEYYKFLEKERVYEVPLKNSERRIPPYILYYIPALDFLFFYIAIHHNTFV